MQRSLASPVIDTENYVHGFHFPKKFLIHTIFLDSYIRFTSVVLSTDSVSGLPFKEAIQDPEAKPESIKMASGPTEISLRTDENEIERPTPPSFSEVVDYISNGFDTLKGLNFNSFQHIYPVFLSILAAAITALILLTALNILQSINHAPIIGGLLSRLFELCGIVAVSRFVSSNLLLQRRRAALFVRIAALKREFIGQ